MQTQSFLSNINLLRYFVRGKGKQESENATLHQEFEVDFGFD